MKDRKLKLNDTGNLNQDQKPSLENLVEIEAHLEAQKRLASKHAAILKSIEELVDHTLKNSKD